MTRAWTHYDTSGDAMTINDDDARRCSPSRCSTTMVVETLDYDNVMMLDNAHDVMELQHVNLRTSRLRGAKFATFTFLDCQAVTPIRRRRVHQRHHSGA
eukprot:241637-Rhodomonas_salina.1